MDLCSDPGAHTCKVAVEFYDEIAAETRKLAGARVFPADRNFTRDLLRLAIYNYPAIAPARIVVDHDRTFAWTFEREAHHSCMSGSSDLGRDACIRQIHLVGVRSRVFAASIETGCPIDS